MAIYCTDPAFIAGYVGISLALMAFIIALFYMAAQFFRRPEYEGFASVELYQLGVSAFLLVTLFSASCFAAHMAGNFSGRDQFDIAREYLDYMSNKISLPAVITLEGTKLTLQYLGSMTIRYGPSVWGVILPAFPAMVVLERVVDFLLLLIIPFTSSIIVQIIGLEIIRGIMLPFVLPAGLVLRIFPPTRDAGSFLIAVAIGFEVIFPYTYVMHDTIVRGMLVGTPLTDPEALSHVYMNENIFASVINGLNFNFIEQLWNPMELLSYLLLQALFLPALSMTITIAFIKSFMKFISQKLG